MRKRNILLGISLLMAVFSCNRLEEPAQAPVIPEAKVFYGETPSGTKTFLDADSKMYWAHGDLVALFQSSVNEQYINVGTDGSAQSELQKNDATVPTAPFSRNYAFYPWAECVSSATEGTLSFTLPDTQSYVPNSFAPGANPMTSATENLTSNQFQFDNLCGFLVLRLYGTATVRRIRFRGNNNEVLCGAGTATVAYGETPVLALSPEGGKQLTLDCGELGVTIGNTPENATSFWLVVPPTTFTKGFTFEVEGTCGTVTTRSTDKSVSIARSHAQPMAAFEVQQNGINLLSFSLSDGVNTYRAFDISNGYVNVQVPNGTDMTNLVASFNYSGVGVSVNNVPQTSGADAHDFSDFVNRVQYVITGALGNTQTYIVRLFDLPVVVINTPSPITSKEVWTEGCSMVIRTDDGTVTADYGQAVQVRGRGNSTWGYPKKPYAIKLDKKAEVLGMPKHKRWVLLANWMDRTLLRNDVAFAISKRTGLAYTPRGQFVELILNGNHVGNFYLCEQIKVDENRVNIKSMKAKDIAGDALTGGYLMELDTYYDEVNKFKSAIRNLPYMFKDPDEDVLQPAQFSYMESYVNSFESVLYADDWMETRAYDEYIELNSFVDYWFVIELIKNTELGHPKSMYMHKDRNGELTAGPVWDSDWGTFIPSKYEEYVCKNNLYFKQLFEDPCFRYIVKERWASLKPGFDTIPAYIRAVAEEIRRSNEINLVMWPLSAHASGAVNKDADLSFDDSVDRLVEAYTHRLAWLDEKIAEMTSIAPLYPTLDGSVFNPSFGGGWNDEDI